MLQHLLVGKDKSRKEASIGQAIVQAVRLRSVIAPLQVGLAVQMRHHSRSKFCHGLLLLIFRSSEVWGNRSFFSCSRCFRLCECIRYDAFVCSGQHRPQHCVHWWIGYIPWYGDDSSHNPTTTNHADNSQTKNFRIEHHCRNASGYRTVPLYETHTSYDRISTTTSSKKCASWHWHIVGGIFSLQWTSAKLASIYARTAEIISTSWTVIGSLPFNDRYVF